MDRVSVGAVLGAFMIGRMIIDPQRLSLKLANENRLTEKNAPVISAELVEWGKRDSARPFVAILNYFDAHDPYDDAPPPFNTMVGEGDRPSLPLNPTWDREAITQGYDGHDRSITYLDSESSAY